MSGTTSRGAPYATDGDSNNLGAVSQALAQWANDRPGIATLSTTQRNSLGSVELWSGRVIWNTTVARYEFYDGTVWQPLEDVSDWVAIATGATADAAYRSARYRVTTFGQRRLVEMEGVFSYSGGGGLNGTMFVMPAALRPTQSEVFLCYASNSTLTIRIDVMIDGTVILRTATGAGVSVSLKGIRYWLD